MLRPMESDGEHFLAYYLPKEDADAEGPADPLGPDEPEAECEGRALKLAKLSVDDCEDDPPEPPPMLAAILFTAKTTPHTTSTITRRARISAMIRRRR